MRWYPRRFRQLLAVAAAVVLGAVLASWQSRPDPNPNAPDQRVSDAAPPAGPAPPQPAAAGTVGGRAAEPAAGTSAAPPTNTPTDAARPAAVAGDGKPRPAPLPAFFDNAFGPPVRDAAGELVKGTPHELQARLAQERRDDAWADKVEWQLENFLALQPLTERVGNPAVLCRATVCRVVATADRSALPAAASEEGWQEMMAALRYESVSNEFSDTTDLIVFNASEPERIGFVTYFERTEVSARPGTGAIDDI